MFGFGRERQLEARGRRTAAERAAARKEREARRGQSAGLGPPSMASDESVDAPLAGGPTGGFDGGPSAEIASEGEPMAAGEGESMASGDGELMAPGDGELMAVGGSEPMAADEGELMAAGEGELMASGGGELRHSAAPSLELDGVDEDVDGGVEEGAGPGGGVATLARGTVRGTVRRGEDRRAGVRGMSLRSRRGSAANKPSGGGANARGAGSRMQGGGASRRGGGVRANSLRARVAALLSLALVAVVVWLIVSIFQPFHGPGHGRVEVVIPPGAGVSGVGKVLAADGVISSPLFFDVHAFLEGARDLSSGSFVLKRGMSYSAAISALSGASPDRAEVKVVIPEGETRAQIAAIARKDGLRGNYMRASSVAPGFEPSRYGASKRTHSLEGFLFPATYDVEAGANVSKLVSAQLEAFNERFGSAELKRARALHISGYDLLTIASMIEREAKLPQDRPLIAAVIFNRLRLHMALGIDATIRYALRDYGAPLTEKQLHTPSPYNTRLHKGLPPTPISNPGEEAIEAAAHPAKVGYLYYVNGADGCGDLVFSTSFAQFEEDSAAYDAALRDNGGNLPACKHK